MIANYLITKRKIHCKQIHNNNKIEDLEIDYFKALRVISIQWEIVIIKDQVHKMRRKIILKKRMSIYKNLMILYPLNIQSNVKKCTGTNKVLI